MRQLRSARPRAGIHLVRGGKDGTNRQERVAALGAQPLAVALLALAEGLRVALPVPGADVVDDDVARDVVGRLLGRDPPSGPADHDAELHLEVQGTRAFGTDHGLPVADDGVGELGEQHGPVGRRPAPLLCVIPVVEAHAHDLAGLDLVHRRGRTPGVEIQQRRAGLERAPGRPPQLTEPVVLEPDLEADAQVGVDGGIEPAPLLELRSRQEAPLDEHAEPLVAEAVVVGVEAHGSTLRQFEAGLGSTDAPADGLAEGTAHCGSGGATNRPSDTRSP